jgi:hypothetical protein
MVVIFFLLLASLSTTQSLRPNLTPKTIKEQLTSSTNYILPAIATAISITTVPSLAKAADQAKGKSFEYQPALAGLDYGKPRTYYPDFVQKVSGLQYKVVKEGII